MDTNRRSPTLQGVDDLNKGGPISTNTYYPTLKRIENNITIH